MLQRTLAAEGFEVTAAPDGAAALVATERSAPDVIVLDVAMPGLDGLAVCRRLRAKGLATPILMLTARDAVADRVAGLEAGADDYLIKPFASEELVARGRSLMRGGRAIELTGREAALLELLLRQPGRTVTREYALEQIWEGAAEANVVDRYITRLRRKLGPPALIRTVRGSGFTLRA
jgi:two-component system response regulator MprA